MRTVLQDIRFGIRQLIKIPGVRPTAIVSLALGIGATTESGLRNPAWRAAGVDPMTAVRYE